MKVCFRRRFLPCLSGFFFVLAALAVFAAGSGAAHAQVVTAGAQQAQFPMGGITVALPAPPGQGMVEVGNDRNFFDPAVPDSNRLLAAFVLEKDAATLRNASNQVLTPYAMVEVLRAGEYSTVSQDDFKEIADSIAKQTGALIDSSFKESEEEFNRKMKAMDLNVQVTYGKPVMLGTFFLKPDAYGFGMMAPVTANGKTTSMIVGTVLLRVKSHVIFAYFYSTYQNDQTPGQVRAVSEQWADAILAANR